VKKAVYTGSFDPITLGHLNIIERGSRLVDQLVVGIGINREKVSLFEPAERLELVQRCTTKIANLTVTIFEGLAVDFVRHCGARVMIRGVRPLTDIAAEFTMTVANRRLDDKLETIFLMADSDFVHVSSTLIKQIARLADDDQLAQFVPREIIPDLRAKLN
jgi:pantetheine-phosphate adenylyltransferase